MPTSDKGGAFVTCHCCLPFLVLSCFLVTQAFAADIVQERGGVPNFFRKLAKANRGEKNEKGEDVLSRVVYLGGSITEGAGASKPTLCYRALLTARLHALYPKATLFETNAAIGGTTSWLGAFRLRADVFDHWVPTDLVVIEFAVNDGSSPEPQVYASMEGIVRQLLAQNPFCDILFVYTLAQDQIEAYKKGELPDRIKWHEKIAEHYGIPSVNVSQSIAQKVIAGELKFEEFAKDGVHPTDKGYALYMEALAPFVARCKDAAEQPAAPVKHVMPKPFSDRAMDKAKMIPYERVTLDDKWKIGQESPVGRFFHVAASDTPGATIAIRFKGDCIGYFDTIGPDTGDLEFSLDGGDWKPRSNWDIWAKGGYRPHCRIVAEELDANAVNEVKLRIAEKQPPESKGRFYRPAFFLVNGDLATDDPYKGMTPLQRLDALYGAMEPVKFVPPADRWKYLPETMKRLNDGGALRIVMLGDSIIGDTSSSQWDKLLERLYPKCKVVKVTSVRGSTGCWWYKDENRVQEWVLKHKPDLLLIGGISQRGDIEAIRSVIKQVRAAANPEIMLMTGAFGELNPKKGKDWRNIPGPNGADYGARLMQLAADEKCEFLDMTAAWGEYIAESARAMGWFKRDPVHGNERGFQILGRILEKYFAPK
ncbi:MAG: SGNH/GDSL hydrolase family protein [Planctomycetota bacterium]|nr:SGNH/GDSL hydrolase family protein [Planctomycetota bacterium]